jgi:2-(1,2-epoxy-1,2-dihydrophenyl)acetyl-CoA isomerase
MMLLGERLSADEAREWGLVWRVVEDQDLAAETDRIAGILAERSPSAIASTKRLIAAASDFEMDQQLDLERDLQGEAGRSPDMREAVAKFFAAKSAAIRSD